MCCDDRFSTDFQVIIKFGLIFCCDVISYQIYIGSYYDNKCKNSVARSQWGQTIYECGVEAQTNPTMNPQLTFHPK